MPADDETPLEGGMVSGAVRVGDTVRRPIARWSEAAHGVLRHLSDARFDGAPRLLGVDDSGREILSWIPGTAATRPWPDELLHDDGLARLGTLLRSYHDAVRGYRPPDETEWWTGRRLLADGEIVLHGDPGPWNTIWRRGEPVAFVDFDFVAPGPPLQDLAYAAFFCVPLGDDEHCLECGFETVPDRARRLRVFCDAYGWTAGIDLVYDCMIDYFRREAREIETLGRRGVTPWAGYLERELHEEDRRTVKWLEANRAQVL